MNKVRLFAMGCAVLGGGFLAYSQLAGPTAQAPAMDQGLAAAPAAAGMGAPTLNPAPETPSLIQTADAGPSMIGSSSMIGSGAMPTAPSALAPSGMPPVAGDAAMPQGMQTAQIIGAPALNASAPLANATVLVPPTTVMGSDGTAVTGATAEILQGLARGAESNPAFPAPIQPMATDTPTVALDATLQAELSACAVWLVITPAPGALLDASVYAPCDRSAEIEISHAGLVFDARLGEDGQLLLQIPAFATDATVTARFADGREQSDTIRIDGMAQIDRVALQWNSPAILALHAYEFGAQYGEPGHIHAGNPQGPGNPARGFMTVLGDASIPNGRMAQVYSFAMGQSTVSGQVALEIEAPVTDTTCGQAVNANAFQIEGGASGQVRAISLEMPACDGAGGYVVLPGVLPDLQIALN